MNNLKSLIRLQFKDFLGRARGGLNVKNKLLGKILQVLVLAALATPAINFSLLTYKVFVQLGQPILVITSMYVNSVMLMFFLGIPFIVSVFFFSKDIDFLSALPIKESDIVLSKLSTVYIYMFAINLLLIGPSMIIYAINNAFNLVFLIMSLLAIILAPVLPLLISALMVLFFSHFLINTGRKNLFTIIGNILLILVIIGIQMLITRYISNPEYLQNALSSKSGLIGFIGMRFPPSIWLTKMLLGSVKDTILFLAINLAFLLLLQRLAAAFYKKALAAYSQGGQASGKIYYVRRSKGWQMIKRHILIILKEPNFMLNSVLTLLVPVIMILVMSVSGQLSLSLFKSPELQPYIILILTGILSAPAIFGSISATAITREGQSFWESKVLPISARDNLRYRVLTTIIFDICGVILLLTISLFILPLTGKIVLLGLLFSIIATIFFATIDIIINIYRPLLNWTNPTAAIKNNMNVMISLAIRIVLASLFYLIYLAKPDLIMVDFERTIIVVGLGLLILYFIVRRLLYQHLVKRFTEIST